MTVSRDWPKTLRSNISGSQEHYLDASLCSTGTLSNIFLTTNASISDGGSVRNATIHHIPIYPAVVGHIPHVSTSATGSSGRDCGGTQTSALAYDQVTAVHLHPATLHHHHQIIGTATGNFLNFALSGSNPVKLTDQIPNEGSLFSVGSAAGSVATGASQNEKKALEETISTTQAIQTGMADESLDQKYFVFNTNVQQSIPSTPPPTLSSNALSQPHHHHQHHQNHQHHGGGSLNVLSLSAVHHPQTHHSLQLQNSLPLVCASAASSLSAMDALHSTKEQKVSVQPAAYKIHPTKLRTASRSVHNNAFNSC